MSDDLYVFSEEQERLIVRIVRESAVASLRGSTIPDFKAEAEALNMNGQCGGVFVTYKRKGHLRGCIGIFSPKDHVFAVIQSRAIASLSDMRFSYDRITLKEFEESIDITVSVLSIPRVVKDPRVECKAGVHGIICSKHGRRGTYLPQVATENNWEIEEFVRRCTLNKAGISTKDPFNDPDIVFESYVATLVSDSAPQ